MTTVLWVTEDGSDMPMERHKQLEEHYVSTGVWTKCFKFTDMTSDRLYEEIANDADVIAFEEHFPLHLLPRIMRKDKACFVAVTIQLSSPYNRSCEIRRWKRIEQGFMCAMTDILS